MDPEILKLIQELEARKARLQSFSGGGQPKPPLPVPQPTGRPAAPPAAPEPPGAPGERLAIAQGKREFGPNPIEFPEASALFSQADTKPRAEALRKAVSMDPVANVDERRAAQGLPPDQAGPPSELLPAPPQADATPDADFVGMQAIQRAIAGEQAANQPAPQEDYYKDPEDYLQRLLQEEQRRQGEGPSTGEALSILLSGVARGFGVGPDPFDRASQIQGMKDRKLDPQRRLEQSILSQKARKAQGRQQADISSRKAQADAEREERGYSFRAQEGELDRASRQEAAKAGDERFQQSQSRLVGEAAMGPIRAALYAARKQLGDLERNATLDPDYAAKRQNVLGEIEFLMQQEANERKALGLQPIPDDLLQNRLSK